MAMTLTEEKRFVVLLSIIDLGGFGTKKHVLNNIEEKTLYNFSEYDLEEKHNRKELVWRNDLAFVRKWLVDNEYVDGKKYDNWEITGNGKKYFCDLVDLANSSSNFEKITQKTIFEANNLYLDLKRNEIESIFSNDIDDENIPEGLEVIVIRKIRDTKKAKKLKVLYDFKCQICNKALELPTGSYAEGHHIKPLGKTHNGSDTENNLIILCPNHHAEFDYGSIALDPNSMKVIHINKHDPYHGKSISLDPHHKLNPEYIKYHLENIFRK